MAHITNPRANLLTAHSVSIMDFLFNGLPVGARSEGLKTLIDLGLAECNPNPALTRHGVALMEYRAARGPVMANPAYFAQHWNALTRFAWLTPANKDIHPEDYKVFLQELESCIPAYSPAFRALTSLAHQSIVECEPKTIEARGPETADKRRESRRAFGHMLAKELGDDKTAIREIGLNLANFCAIASKPTPDSPEVASMKRGEPVRLYLTEETINGFKKFVITAWDSAGYRRVLNTSERRITNPFNNLARRKIKRVDVRFDAFGFTWYGFNMSESDMSIKLRPIQKTVK